MPQLHTAFRHVLKFLGVTINVPILELSVLRHKIMYLGHKIMCLGHRLTCLKCLRYRVMCLKYLGIKIPFDNCRMFIFQNVNVFT